MKLFVIGLATFIANIWLCALLLNYLVPLKQWWGFPLYMTIAIPSMIIPIALLFRYDWNKKFPPN